MIWQVPKGQGQDGVTCPKIGVACLFKKIIAKFGPMYCEDFSFSFRPTHRLTPWRSVYSLTNGSPGNARMASRVMLPPACQIPSKNLEQLLHSRCLFGVWPEKAPIQNEVVKT